MCVEKWLTRQTVANDEDSPRKTKAEERQAKTRSVHGRNTYRLINGAIEKEETIG